jgi:hypothetical protein
MRCISCGEQLSRERLGVAGAGFAMCTECMARAGIHRHVQTIELPDGTTVGVASYLGNEQHAQRTVKPDFGVYLDSVWSPPWPHMHLQWPDFGLPADETMFHQQCVDVLRRCRLNERVEIGCVGGHGRTGTMLAVLAVMTGVPSSEAVAWVRQVYCASAVETDEQQQFVNLYSAM